MTGRRPKDGLTVPKRAKRKRSIKEADAHLMVARTAASIGPPPYICVTTRPPPAPCLRYTVMTKPENTAFPHLASRWTAPLAEHAGGRN